ncbi:SET and MYND domain-containing protein 4-like isoform X1 [Pectinophora gossypiella]|uniref:SET and MYND domain-containing protein 4-like isoform X1 n=1 Tax=Pectinophora gossypiella TaxID=13191 RepID=UPI00214EE2D8|nr:SET and MYND domain-containing protein 4-like isoform X1 [Pectinophora gossypiella]
MFTRPVQFHEFLTHHGFIDDIYKAMNKSDLAEPVMTVLNILTKTNSLPPLLKEPKSESKSTAFRNEGNQAYGSKKYQRALICYNKALLYAPKNSRAMKLAYSNRSALLLKVKSFSACLSDIETCFSMGCPLEIIEKLRKRKDEARSYLWVERLAKDARSTVFTKEYFKCNMKRNPQIPCATTNVGIILEDQVPKVVATTDIKVGVVLAVETAFVSQNDPQNAVFSCYYCHKMSLNLKPCDGCNIALFCNENCRENCMREYHSIECQIIEVLDALYSGSMLRMAVKAVLKMKNMSKSWSDFIAASHTTGMNRLKTSSINEIYDSNYKYSLLNIKDERHFLHGPLYNACFNCASIVHYLEKVSCFLPQPADERKSALQALARMLMFLTLYSTHTQVIMVVAVNEVEKTEFHDIANYGWFSFIGKLRNSCNPNVLAVGLNKKTALLAIAPIKRGTELTISYVGHWLDNSTDKEIRHKNMFILCGVVCNCVVCTGEYEFFNNAKLTDVQKKNVRKLNLEEMGEQRNWNCIPEIFAKLCKTLALLSDLPYSDEYAKVYTLFRRCVLCIQDLTTENLMLDYV